MDLSNPSEINAPQSNDLHVSPATQTGDGPKFLAQMTVDTARTKSWLTNVLLAVNIVVLLVVWVEDKDKRTQAWLNGDEFNKFISGPYADQRSDIRDLQRQIQKIQSCGK